MLIDQSTTHLEETRRELVRAYMNLEGTSLDKGTTLLTHGCGFSHPADKPPENASPDQPADRRVEVFLFDGTVTPPPRSLCPLSGCPEYQQWVDQKSLDVDLDQPAGALKISLVDEASKKPIDGARVHASGPLVLDAETKDGGVALIREILPGDYKVIASKAQFQAADATAAVTSGSEISVELALKPLVSFVEILLSDTDGNPVPGARYLVTTADGSIKEGKLDDKGFARVENVLKGKVSVSFPDLDEGAVTRES